MHVHASKAREHACASLRYGASRSTIWPCMALHHMCTAAALVHMYACMRMRLYMHTCRNCACMEKKGGVSDGVHDELAAFRSMFNVLNNCLSKEEKANKRTEY